MQKTYRTQIIQPTGFSILVEEEKRPTLSMMQSWVGGLIEPLSVLYEGKECTMLCHEEALCMSDPQYNRTATKLFYDKLIKDHPSYEGTYPIYGTVAVLIDWDLE